MANFDSGRRNLILIQLLMPLIRILFVFLAVPTHPMRDLCLSIFITAEISSTFMVLGKAYLIQGGFNPEIFSKRYKDVGLALLCGMASIILTYPNIPVYYIHSIIFLCGVISICSIEIAWALRRRKFYQVACSNVIIYVAAIVSPYACHPALALISLLGYSSIICIRYKTGRSAIAQHVPAIANVISFLAQRLDVQAALLLSSYLDPLQVFQYATLLMPVALISRFMSNTALITGETSGVKGRYKWIALPVSGLVYSAIIYLVARASGNSFVVENFHLLLLVPPLALMTIPAREAIGVSSSNGNFRPFITFSILAFIFPLFVWLALRVGANVSVGGFVIMAYIAPRCAMLMYGFFSKELKVSR